jgi:aryl-alcohol dehydrogenase-like predicted oxidoreductase
MQTRPYGGSGPQVPVLGFGGVGTIAKCSLAGRPWHGAYSGDAVQDEYRRRFEALRPAMALAIDGWDAFALRFAAFAPGVDCVIVGGTDVANVDRNVAAVRRGPLELEERLAVGKAWEAVGRHWEGLV